MKLFDPPVREKNIFGRTWLIWFQTIKEILCGEETIIGTKTLKAGGASRLDSNDSAVTGTLNSGEYIGQIKTIVMTDATNSSTVSVTNHETSDPEVGTFDAVDETWILMWTGTEWVTIKATCTF